MRHTIAQLSFREGRIACACGAAMTNRDATPFFGQGHSNYLAPAKSPEALAGAFQQHRRDVNAGEAAVSLRTEDSPLYNHRGAP